MDYSYRRSAPEAVGFYLAYLLLSIIVGAISGVVYSTIIGSSDGFHDGMKAGSVMAVIYCTVLGFCVIRSRKTYKRFVSILIYLLTILSSLLFGSLLALVFVAVLTTIKSEEEKLPADNVSAEKNFSNVE